MYWFYSCLPLSVCLLELTAFWWMFDSEGLHGKAISFLPSLARLGCCSFHSALLSTFLRRVRGACSWSEHHRDSVPKQSRRALQTGVQLQINQYFAARGRCSALARVGEWEHGDSRDAHTAVGVPAAQPRLPNSQSPLSGVKPPASSAIASKMPSSSVLVDNLGFLSAST